MTTTAGERSSRTTGRWTCRAAGRRARRRIRAWLPAAGGDGRRIPATAGPRRTARAWSRRTSRSRRIGVRRCRSSLPRRRRERDLRRLRFLWRLHPRATVHARHFDRDALGETVARLSCLQDRDEGLGHGCRESGSRRRHSHTHRDEGDDNQPGDDRRNPNPPRRMLQGAHGSPARTGWTPMPASRRYFKTSSNPPAENLRSADEQSGGPQELLLTEQLGGAAAVTPCRARRASEPVATSNIDPPIVS